MEHRTMAATGTVLSEVRAAAASTSGITLMAPPRTDRANAGGSAALLVNLGI
jgi:hypothetical protein